MKQLDALLSSSLVHIIGGMISIFFLISGFTPSLAGADPAPDAPPALTWGRIYNYSSFHQLLDNGGGEVVALAIGKDPKTFHLVRFSSSGDIVWDHTFGGANLTYASSLTRTKDGGMLICGSIDFKNETGPINRDILLVKTDVEGNQQWQKTFDSGANMEWGWFAWQREDGGYTIFGGIHVDDAPDDFYVAQTDSTGTLLTERRFSAMTDVLGAGSLYANGKTTRDGGCIVHTQTGLIKLTSMGAVEWNTDYNLPNYHIKLYDVVQTPDEGYACVIWRVDDSPYTEVGFLKKLDPVGNEIWTIIISDVDTFYPFIPEAIQLTSDQGLIIAGSNQLAIDGKRTIFKIDLTGMVQWSLFIPGYKIGNVSIELLSIIEQGPNQYIVAGQTTSTISSGHGAYLGRIGTPPTPAGARFGAMYSLRIYDDGLEWR